MSLVCKAFGHKPPIYKSGLGSEYAKASEGYKDGIGRLHSEVRGECARCGNTFLICKIHLPCPKGE